MKIKRENYRHYRGDSDHKSSEWISWLLHGIGILMVAAVVVLCAWILYDYNWHLYHGDCSYWERYTVKYIPARCLDYFVGDDYER